MFLSTRPSESRIRAFLESQRTAPFSYVEQGASRGSAPAGYTVDHNRIQLGHGAKTFTRAVNAIRHWKMFDAPWIQLCWPDTPIELGSTVAVLARHYGFWSLNACRVVYMVAAQGPLEPFGFGYGTLGEHAESGEERFTVEMLPADETVWYEIYAFSRPRRLARLGYPLARRLQKRFQRDSKEAMRRAVVTGG